MPYALLFGAIRGIPVWWRLIDWSLGLFALNPMALCHQWAAELETQP